MADVRKADSEERVSPLAEQWPYLRFLGLGAWWAWIWLCYNSTEIMRMFPAGDQTANVLQMYLFSTLGIAASMFAAALAWKRVTVLVDKRFVVVGFGAFAGLSTILLGFSVVMGAGVFFFLAAVFTGIGTSFLCLKVGRVYGSVSLGDSLTAGAISLVFASLLYFAGVGIAPELRLFYLAALPLVSALLLVMGAADPFPSAMSGAGEDLDRRSPERRVYRKLVAASALVALTAGIGKGVSSALVPTETFAREGGIIVLCVGVIGVLIAYVVNRGDAVRGARQVYSGLMVLGVAMMLSTCFGFDIAYLSVGKESLWLVFSCFMAYLAFRYDFSPVRMFAIGQGVYFLASTAGWAVGSALAPYYGDSMVRMGTGIALAFMVIVVLVYVFPEIDLKRVMAWSVDSERGERAPVKRATVPAFASASAGDAEVAASIGVARATDQRYGLSSRELEILDLFAAGNTIADRVTCLSTMRCHSDPTVPNVSPMGHTRQNSGMPAISVATRTTPSAQVRRSRARWRMLAASPFASRAAEHVRCAVAGAVAASWTDSAFGSRLKNPRILGAGQPQAHQARPNSSANAKTTASEISVTGTSALDASNASMPPSGHSRKNWPRPNDEGVPRPKSKASDAMTATNTKASVATRAFVMRSPCFIMHLPLLGTSFR